MRQKRSKIVYYFPQIDMRNSHAGLTRIAISRGLNPEELKKGELILFTNTAFTKLKILATGGVMLYYSSPEQRRIPHDVIPLLPDYFNGTSLAMDAAIKEAVIKQYSRFNKTRGKRNEKQ